MRCRSVKRPASECRLPGGDRLRHLLMRQIELDVPGCLPGAYYRPSPPVRSVGSESEIETHQVFGQTTYVLPLRGVPRPRGAHACANRPEESVAPVPRPGKAGAPDSSKKNRSTCRFLAVWFDYVDEMVRKAVAAREDHSRT